MVEALIRCPWCGTDPLYVNYHDNEWWLAIHDDSTLFEFLILEWAQAWLSWITVLRKRENYRSHFHNWDIEKISEMTDDELENLLLDPGEVRNRIKIYYVCFFLLIGQVIFVIFLFWKKFNLISSFFIFLFCHCVINKSIKRGFYDYYSNTMYDK